MSKLLSSRPNRPYERTRSKQSPGGAPLELQFKEEENIYIERSGSPLSDCTFRLQPVVPRGYKGINAWVWNAVLNGAILLLFLKFYTKMHLQQRKGLGRLSIVPIFATQSTAS